MIALGLVAVWLGLGTRSADDPAILAAPGAAGARAHEDRFAEFAREVGVSTASSWERLVREALASRDPEILRLLPDLLRRWIEGDMRGFLAFLHDLEVSDETGDIWAILGPALLAALPDLDDRAASSPLLPRIIQRVVMNTARTNPHLALEWAREWLQGSILDSALAGIVLYLAKEDLEASMAVTVEIRAVPNRLAAILAVSRVYGNRDSQAALRWARALPGDGDRAYAIAAVLAAMAGSEPGSAGEIYQQTVGGMQKAFTAKVLAEHAQSGMAWEDIYEGMTPEAARQALMSLPDPNLQYFQSTAFQIGSSLAAGDPAAALAWASSLPEQQGGSAALAGVLGTWAAKDPGAAWNAFQSLQNPSPEVATRFFESWASVDPSRASGAVGWLPSGSVRTAAIDAVVAGWSESGASTGQLSRWVETLTETADLNRARAAVAAAIALQNPLGALQHVRSISDPNQQSAAFSEIFPSLADTHPKAAMQAVASLPLPDVQREYYLSMLEPILNP